MSRLKWIFLIAALVLLAYTGWRVYERLHAAANAASSKVQTGPVPVEVATVEQGIIELQRTFTGTLEAHAEFVVAPKVSGRIEALSVDLSDRVTRGQVLALLDDAEYQQAVARATADREIARANSAEAASLLGIAERELQRNEDLRERGVSSASQRDLAKAEQLAKQAQVEVTRAQIARAEADLAAARIRLGYTQVTADWQGGGDRRVVAERYVDEGETVSANTSLLRIVEFDPIIAVFSVTERDYARLQTGMAARITTDAYPDEVFSGEVERIAPVFRETTRQARVELSIENHELRLKPGMFARATVTLQRSAPDAVIVPQQALVKRDADTGVFVLNADGNSVHWQAVETGIEQAGRVQIVTGLSGGKVVVLGQQLLADGSAVTRVVANAGSKR